MGRDIMRALAIIVCVGIIGGAMGATRDRREADSCNKEDLQAEYDQCSENARTEYEGAFKKGTDGRPDFFERKSCNHVTAVIEVVGVPAWIWSSLGTYEIIKSCVDEEKLNE